MPQQRVHAGSDPSEPALHSSARGSDRRLCHSRCLGFSPDFGMSFEVRPAYSVVVSVVGEIGLPKSCPPAWVRFKCRFQPVVFIVTSCASASEPSWQYGAASETRAWSFQRRGFITSRARERSWGRRSRIEEDVTKLYEFRESLNVSQRLRLFR